MYYEYFGLDRPPFKITPDTDFFFAGGNRGAVLDALLYAVTHGEGIVKVVGEVGSGKTMLCRMLQARLPAQIEQVYLANPSVSPEEILHAIAFELGLSAARDASRVELMHLLQEHLVRRHAEGRQVVVFVEESQSMPLATLEEVRLLSNLETKHHKLLQIVLFGQPELDELLSPPDIRQLRERITHSFSLQPLDFAQVGEYLTFRLAAAGYRGPDLFAPKLVRYIADVTGGLTRRVNLVADKALLAAFAANTHTISLAHVQAAVRESEFNPRASSAMGARRTLPAAALLAIGAAFGIGAYWLLGPPRTIPATPAASTSDIAAGSTNAAALAAGGAGGAAAPSTVTRPISSASPDAQAAGDASPSSALTPTSPSAPPESMEHALQSKLDATREWLGKSGHKGYTIQLALAADEPGELQRYLSQIGKFVESDQVYVYRTRFQNKSLLAVVYGEFPSRQAAQAALQALPEAVKKDRPYIRTRGSMREVPLQKP